MRVLVCGSRHFSDKEKMKEVLDDVYRESPFTVLIHGDARGADRLSAQWANGRGDIEIRAFPADWTTYGKAAGPIRNAQMLKEGKPDLVIAFMFKDSRGTKNMVEQATKAGIEAKVIHCE